MRFITTMIVPPISRGAGGRFSRHSRIETNETPESFGKVRKKFPVGATPGPFREGSNASVVAANTIRAAMPGISPQSV